MAGNTFAKIKAGLARHEKILRTVQFSVLVWAPGNDFFTSKRDEIIKRLKECGFEAFTSEELAKRVVSSLPLPEQELEHWQAVNLVIVLEAGVAPATELASYAWDAEFCEKCIVWHPRDWDPARRTTFPSGVLRLFGNRVLYGDQEMQDCTITNECLHRAEALRRCVYLKNIAGVMSPRRFSW